MSAITRITVKVVPGASRDQVVGWLGDALKVRVHAPPEKGRANSAVTGLLAGVLGIPARDVSVCAGHTSRVKIIEVSGLSDAELRVKITDSMA